MSIIYLGKATPASGQGGGSGEAVWGGITGTLSDQTDLADALSAKQDTLVSGTNIKTINNESLLGSGNITISGSVPNQNTAVGATNPLLFWEGTSAEYESGGGSQTWYNWQYTSGGSGSWTSETSGVSNDLCGVTYGNNKYIAVGSGGAILSSSDGSTWTSEASGGTELLNGVTYANNKFIAVGESGVIISSSDGSTWTSETSGVSESLLGVTYGNNKFIAVGYDMNNSIAIILSSSDGSTWTSETSGVSNDLRGVTYGDNKFIAVGYIGTILTSSDGSTWTSVISGVYESLLGVTYANNKFIAVGLDGAIFSYSSGGQTLSCFTTESTPTTASTVYSAPNTTSALTITAVGTGTITLSDTNTYDYNASGNQTTTQTVGEAHPSWICMIEGVGIKKGSTTIASIAPTVDQTYNASSTNAQSGVAVASGISEQYIMDNCQI